MNNMEAEFDGDVARRKASMIVFCIERALGSYVFERQKGQDLGKVIPSIEMIEAREGAQHEREELKKRLKTSIAASYLDEILSIALTLSDGTSERQPMEELVGLCSRFELYKIRNAVSHPNRVFPESYWYRVAAIASDPVISKLGLESVSVALQAAEEGKITLPPEEWLNVHRSFIRNNLPKQFEHDLTGLVGRQTERKELLGLLSKGKHGLVAVVAPGGLGKTAIILEVLQELTLDPENQEQIDSVVYVTLKQERLTADGIEKLDASQTVEQLRDDLAAALHEVFPDADFDGFQGACHILKPAKVIICIDNLETIASDKPEDFLALYEEMPSSWRVVITSRVSVDSAKTYSLGMLNDDGSRALSYRYLASKGEEDAPKEIVDKICSAAAGNPLAVRLMIDRFVRGFQVVEAAAQTSRDIVAFSYKNLVKTLSDQAIFVLEALFVRESFARSELCELLGLGGETIGDALRQLVRTSLVTRKSSVADDFYSLSPTVRELLRENPTDLTIRKKVKDVLASQARIVRKHQSIQSQHGFSQFSEDYIPEHLPSGLGSVLVVAIKLLRSDNATHSQLISAIERLRRAIDPMQPSALALVTLARLSVEAGDDLEAGRYFSQAISAGGNSPMSKLAYVNFLLQREKVEEALPISENLIQDGWGDPNKSDPFTARRAWQLYFRGLKDTGQHDSILQKAELMLDDPELAGTARVACVQALILKAQPMHTEDPLSASQLLDKAIAHFSAIPESMRVKQWYGAFRFFCKEVKHLLDKNQGFEYQTGFKKRLPLFLAENIVDAYDDLEPRNRRATVSRLVKTLVDTIGQNAVDAFAKGSLKMYLPVDNDRLRSELKDRGYSLLTVYKVPNSRDGLVNFVFAECPDQNPFFIPRSSCENFDWELWAKLDVGSQLGAKDFDSGRTARDYPVAKSVWLL